MEENVRKKNYFRECLKGMVTAALFTIFCTIGYGLGANYEERQWLGKFDWYGYLVILVGGIFGQTLQAIIIFELLGL